MAHATKGSLLNLPDALSRRAYNNAVLCTYTFEPSFFEDYCLQRLSALSSNNNISVCTDYGTYQKIVLAPDSERPKHINLRYLLSPIETNGCFHPKLFLLSTKTSGRLILGSANFTRPGLTSNAELADVFDFELGEQEAFLPLFQDAFAFISSVAEQWPTKSLDSNVQELLGTTPWLQGSSHPDVGSVRLLHNLENPLWDQIVAMVPRPVDRIHVLSRFFDNSPKLIDRLMRDFEPKRLFLYTQNGVTTMTADWLMHPCVLTGRADILLCTYEDEGHPQPLHAKAIVFESGQTRTLVYGSANFTSSALLTHGKAGNIETVVIVPNISAEALDPLQFCDPSGSAHRVQSPDELKSAPHDEVDHFPAMPVRLHEASLNGKELLMRASIPPDTPIDSLVAKLQIQSSYRQLLPITRISAEQLLATVPERSLSRMQESSTLVSIESAGGHRQLSNLVFVSNLLDIKTQNSVQKERQMREATQSPDQFFAVLNDLIRAGDSDALLTFLSLCDIPLVNLPRLSARRTRPVWKGPEGMRQLGERNLQICRTLHNAVLRFFERHVKKLKRHAETLALDGASNFLHIFLTMGGLLRSQVERLVIALEAHPRDINPQEWSEFRAFWDVYFLMFSNLMECLWDDYVKPLGCARNRKDIEQEFGPDLDAIHELCDSMILYRERIERVRNEKCLRREPGGRKIPIGYFHSVLGPVNWQRYASAVQTRQVNVERAVLGHMDHHVPEIHVQPPPRHI